jgi:oligopeptide/dipeptide ABC transporter ATP-binding protein
MEWKPDGLPVARRALPAVRGDRKRCGGHNRAIRTAASGQAVHWGAIVTSGSAVRDDRQVADRNQVLLTTSELTKYYDIRQSMVGRMMRRPSERVRALDHVSLTVRRGETLAVVGETGSGKSTLGRMIVRLEEPSSGDATFDGQSIYHLNSDESARLRQRIQIILQDPYSSLNPYRTVANTIGEVLKVHHFAGDRNAEIDRLLSVVGFPVEMRDRKPGQLSGGGRQRVSIARALAVRPELIVADEPVSALDVSVQAQVLNLFEKLRTELGLTYVFITHDLAVVRRLADRIAVMYLGRVVEEAGCDELFTDPKHPYTKALLAAAPKLDAARGSRVPAVSGEMPDPIDPPTGCVFHPRCPSVMDVCRGVIPELLTNDSGRSVACHLYPPADPGPP